MAEREPPTEDEINETMQSAEDCKDQKEAVDKLVELNQRLSKEDSQEKKLEVLEKIFELYSSLVEEVKEENVDLAVEYQMKAADYCDKIIALPELEDERKEELIDEADSLFTTI